MSIETAGKLSTSSWEERRLAASTFLEAAKPNLIEHRCIRPEDPALAGVKSIRIYHAAASNDLFIEMDTKTGTHVDTLNTVGEGQAWEYRKALRAYFARSATQAQLSGYSYKADVCLKIVFAPGLSNAY